MRKYTGIYIYIYIYMIDQFIYLSIYLSLWMLVLICFHCKLSFSKTNLFPKSPTLVWLFLVPTASVSFVEIIGFTLLYFKMAVMPLVLETKMTDVGKLISPGNLLSRKTKWLVFTTTSRTSILSRVFSARQRLSINTFIFQHSFSFQCDFQREHSHSLHFD